MKKQVERRDREHGGKDGKTKVEASQRSLWTTTIEDECRINNRHMLFFKYTAQTRAVKWFPHVFNIYFSKYIYLYLSPP